MLLLVIKKKTTKKHLFLKISMCQTATTDNRRNTKYCYQSLAYKKHFQSNKKERKQSSQVKLRQDLKYLLKKNTNKRWQQITQ